MNRLVIASFAGILLGFIASRVLFLQYLTLIPWALAGLAIGYSCKNRNDALKAGFAYGFFLGFIFMLAIYAGRDPIITRLPFFVILGIVSAIAGVIAGAVGFFSRRLIKK